MQGFYDSTERDLLHLKTLYWGGFYHVTKLNPALCITLDQELTLQHKPQAAHPSPTHQILFLKEILPLTKFIFCKKTVPAEHHKYTN